MGKLLQYKSASKNPAANVAQQEARRVLARGMRIERENAYERSLWQSLHFSICRVSVPTLPGFYCNWRVGNSGNYSGKY